MKAFKRTLKRIIALSLVLMLAITFVIPTMAADPENGSITIKNKADLPSMMDGQFTAYQVFSGTLVKDSEEPPTGEVFGGYKNHLLGNIDWGKGIDHEQLLKAIIKANKELTEDVDGEEIPNALYGQFDSVTESTTAARLAEILSGSEEPKEEGASRRDSEFMQAFARLVYTCRIEKEGLTSEAQNGETPADDISVIDIGTDYGYYLVVENNLYGSDVENAVISEFILDVFGPRSIVIKASIPSVEKKIIENHDDDEGKDTDTAGIGDTVTFRLTATLPQNYASYEWYYLYFNDTLSKGFDFDKDSVKVYVVKGDEEVEITNSHIESKSLIDDTRTTFPYTTSEKKSENDPTKIIVDLGNLKSDGYDKIFNGEEHAKIDADTTIVVEYSATVNANAVVGNNGNPNEVYLAYSNDPNDQSEFGVTPPDEVKVTEWVAQTETNVAPDGATMVATGDDGHLLISGLDADVQYTMIEAVAPEGYNKIDPFTFEIYDVKTDMNGFTTVNVRLIGTNDHVSDSDLTVTVEGDRPTGTISITAADPKAPELPFTGGMGTYLFYALGGTLFVGSSSYLIFRKKSGKNEDAE